MFNKPSIWSAQEFLNSRAYYLLSQVNTKMWIETWQMTNDEKSKYPSHEACGGYLKDIPLKEAFANNWNNWDEKNRSEFLTMPNFDPQIFEEITGVKI